MILIDRTIIETIWSTREGKFLIILLTLGILFLIYISVTNKRDWLEDAQKRQQTRFEYLNGKPSNAKPKNAKEATKKISQDTHASERKSYSSGWTFNEKTGLWEPPAHMTKKKDK